MGDLKDVAHKPLKRKKRISDSSINTRLKKSLKEEKSDDYTIPSSSSSRAKPRSRGVYLLNPCPDDCRTTSEGYINNREKLTRSITKELLAESKIVHKAIFCEDGVAFDWILDKGVKKEPATSGSIEAPIEIGSSESDSSTCSKAESSETSDSESEDDVSSDSSSEPSTSSTNSNSPQSRKGTFAFRAQTAPMQVPDVQTENIILPKVKYGRPRRLLLRSDHLLPLVSVSMSNDIQLIDRTSKKRLPDLSLPSKSNRGENVQDAVCASNLIVVGRKGGVDQLQMVYQEKPYSKPKIITTDRSPHNGGVNCLSSIYNLNADPTSYEVFSGGFDKTIVRWQIDRRINTFKSKATVLPLRHKACVSALASRDESLFSASGKNVLVSDVRTGAETTSARFGTNINQIHLHPSTRDVVILEVADLDDQMRVYDLRVGLQGRPRMQFGRRDQSTGKHVTSELRKGATCEQYFVRGFEDGIICLWDYRHPNPTPIRVSQQEHPVWHTAFDSSTTAVWSFASNIVGHHQVHF